MEYQRKKYDRVVQLLKKFFCAICLVPVVIISCGNLLLAYDWTTYRHDNTRSSITPERIVPPLSLRWVFKPTHAPKPAWYEPSEEMKRVHFDDAYHVTSANGLVYFGSSVDNKVYALHAESGTVQWTFFTEGPVRYAPTVWKERIFVGSDDGFVYCLDGGTGMLVWKYRAGPSAEKVLGNGRMISLWPVRTSILVADDVVYFGAGIFPYEGIYICALNALDGSVIWKNDTDGERAHELDWGGISPQSYLVASEKILYVPSGRAMPAAFDRKTGQLLNYFPTGGKTGGTWMLLDNNNLITGVDQSGEPAKTVFTMEGKRTDDIHAWFPGIDLVVTPSVSFALTQQGIFALDREKYQVLSGGKLKTIMEERQKIMSRYSDLGRRISAAKNEDSRAQLIQERSEIIRKISDLANEEQALKPTIFKWKYQHEKLNTLMLASTTVFSGGNGFIVAIDAQTGNEQWKMTMNGNIRGLTAANRNLYASADDGSIYCFKEGMIYETKTVKPIINLSPYSQTNLNKVYDSAVWEIVKKTGIRKGYCLVLGCGTGRLAYELANQTELNIIGIEENADKVKEAKKLLDDSGLYGSRVVVEQWDISTLPDYFANLIVSEELLISGKINGNPEEVFRVLKPCGGVAYFGQPLESPVRGKPIALQSLSGWWNTTGSIEPEILKENGTWIKIKRGALEGMGGWTEQFGNPQNTACSGDELVKSPLGVLWFGEPGPQNILERHAKGQSPVSMDGRLFIQGEEVIMAYDAYNGTHLWTREIPGAVRARADVDGGNLKVTEDGLYVAVYDKCYRLDPATGATLRIFELPPSAEGTKKRWGYISYAHNLLYGTRAKPMKNEFFAFLNMFMENGVWKNIDEVPAEYRDEYKTVREKYPVPNEELQWELKRSGLLWRMMVDYPLWENYNPSKNSFSNDIMSGDMFFALNPETGKLRWNYQGSSIPNITISMGDEKIFFTECAVTEELKTEARAKRQELIKRGVYKDAEYTDVPDEERDIRTITALDAATGQKLWEKTLDVTGCGGDALGTAYYNGVLLLFGNTGNHDAYRFKDGTLKWKRMIALSAKDGEMLWSHANNYRTRPVIMGNKVIIEPRACDIYTGEIIMRTHPVSGKQVPWEWLRPGHTCAISGASAHALFYRSFVKAFYDVTADNGVTLFGGIRPNCLISMIPANGVLLSPQGDAGCTCSFPIKCSIVLKHKPGRPQPWNVFVTHGAMTPVKHFAINFGAPADMKDDRGTVWFGYPNPKTVYASNHFPNYGVKFDLKEKITEGMGFFCSDFKGKTIQDSDKSWLFTSGCIGLQKCEIPLIDDAWGENPGVYTVRLGFSAPVGDRISQRVFDVRLQGNVVQKDMDVVESAGVPEKAVVKEFKRIRVENMLTFELIPKESNPAIAQAPIINFIEIIREDDPLEVKDFQPKNILSEEVSDALLEAAKTQLTNKDFEKALEIYHTILDGVENPKMKQKALNGMTIIGSPKSLSRLALFCRDNAPILWNYREPDQELVNCAAKAYIAIANNTAKDNRDKAVKMLTYALKIESADIRKEAVNSLKNLGVEVKD